MNRDLKASDFSVLSWMDLLVAVDVEDLVPLEELEGPATSGWEMTRMKIKTKKTKEKNRNYSYLNQHLFSVLLLLFCFLKLERSCFARSPTQHALLQHVKQVTYQAGIRCACKQSQ